MRCTQRQTGCTVMLIMLTIGPTLLPTITNSVTASEDPMPSFIAHVPIPIAAKGKPLPIVAGIKESSGKLESVTLQIKSAEKGTTTTIQMKPSGEGKYQAIIPAKSTAGSGLLYQIKAVGANGTSETPWYPVKSTSIEDKVKDRAEDSTKDTAKKASKLAGAKAAIVAHPYISAGAGLVTVGAATAAGGGGSSSGGGEPSAYAGSMSGSWSSHLASGTFQVSVSPYGTVTGSYAGTLSGTLSGSVSADGSFQASGSAGAASWSGTVSGSTGSLSASGTWSGYGESGTWHGSGG